MKKMISYIAIMVCATLALVSCSDDDSNATCTYYVATTAVEHSDTLNNQYQDYILANILQHKLSSYTFTETAQSSDDRIGASVAICDEQAIKTFRTKTPSFMSLSDVRDEIFAANQQKLAEKGITKAEDLELYPYSIELTLLNESNGMDPIATTTIKVK